jgi:hypothetical protein
MVDREHSLVAAKKESSCESDRAKIIRVGPFWPVRSYKPVGLQGRQTREPIYFQVVATTLAA